MIRLIIRIESHRLYKVMPNKVTLFFFFGISLLAGAAMKQQFHINLYLNLTIWIYLTHVNFKCVKSRPSGHHRPSVYLSLVGPVERHFSQRSGSPVKCTLLKDRQSEKPENITFVEENVFYCLLTQNGNDSFIGIAQIYILNCSCFKQQVEEMLI